MNHIECYAKVGHAGTSREASEARVGSSYFRCVTGSRWEILSRLATRSFQGDFSKLTGSALLGLDNDAAARGVVGRPGRRWGQHPSERPWPCGLGR